MYGLQQGEKALLNILRQLSELAINQEIEVYSMLSEEIRHQGSRRKRAPFFDVAHCSRSDLALRAKVRLT